MIYSDNEIYDLVNKEEIDVFVDSWDLYRLHNAGQEEAGKDGCTVCAI